MDSDLVLNQARGSTTEYIPLTGKYSVVLASKAFPGLNQVNAAAGLSVLVQLKKSKHNLKCQMLVHWQYTQISMYLRFINLNLTAVQ